MNRIQKLPVHCLWVVWACALVAGPAAAQIPDSPTGRMAQALVELAGSGDEAAVKSFLSERIAPSASRDTVAASVHSMVERCRGGRVRGIRKTGPNAATIRLAAGETTCSVEYVIETAPPHRLAALGVQVTESALQAREAGSRGDGSDAMLRAFAAAVNSGDFPTMQKFYAENATDTFRSRRTVEEDRALYERLRNDMGSIEVRSVDEEGPNRVRLGVRAERMPAPVTFDFDLRDGKIHGFGVQVGGAPDDDADSAIAFDHPAGADEATVVAAVDRELSRLAKTDEFSGVVLVGRPGKAVFHRAYGMADREADRANTTDTRFDIGSITKLLTKIAIGKLAEAGKLGLDDTLAAVLPDYPDQEIARRITLRQLLAHESGLGDIFNDRWDAYPKQKLVSPRDYFPLFADLPLEFEPGQRRAYSNAGYVVLGAVVEAVSGKHYPEYLEQKIFNPAGMKHSGFPVRDGTNSALAVGYTHEGAPGGTLQRNLGMLPLRGCPAGSSSHTADDLWKLDRALRAGKLLGPAWTEWVFTGTLPADAAVVPGVAATYGIGVAGGGPGVNAVLDSDGDLTVVVLSNLDPPSASRLSRELRDAFHRGSTPRIK